MRHDIWANRETFYRRFLNVHLFSNFQDYHIGTLMNEKFKLAAKNATVR